MSGSDESLGTIPNHIPAPNAPPVAVVYVPPTANDRRSWKHLAIPESFEDVDSPTHTNSQTHTNANELCNHLPHPESSPAITPHPSAQNTPTHKKGARPKGTGVANHALLDNQVQKQGHWL